MPAEESAPAPLCGPEEFAEPVNDLVTSQVPRLFAVVQEYGERADARVAAWGMAFEERAEIVSVEGRARMSVRCLDRAVRRFARGALVSARLVWVEQAGDAATT